MLSSYVSSSNVRKVSYQFGILEVEFHNGSVYQYLNVPEFHYHSLIRSSSVGSYLATNIKSLYSYKQVA